MSKSKTPDTKPAPKKSALIVKTNNSKNGYLETRRKQRSDATKKK